MARTKFLVDLGKQLTPTDMETPKDDIDPASLEIFTHVFESPSGRKWLEDYIIQTVGNSHILIRTYEDGIFGYISPDKTGKDYPITIKPEDSWLKKWIKRQLT